MTKNKIIGFRPTDAEKEKINEYMAANSLKKASAAIRAMAFEKKLDPSSMVDKPAQIVKIKGIEHRYFTKLALIPPNLPNVKREIKKFLRGQESEFVKTLLEITPDSLNRAFTCATSKGIITLIPSMHAIPSTTTHDTTGGLA